MQEPVNGLLILRSREEVGLSVQETEERIQDAVDGAGLAESWRWKHAAESESCMPEDNAMALVRSTECA